MQARSVSTEMLFDQERMPAPDEYAYFFLPGEDEGDDIRAMLRDLGYSAAVAVAEQVRKEGAEVYDTTKKGM